MMRKYALLIVAVVAVLALPSSASAGYNCPPPPPPDTPTGEWVGPGPNGEYIHYYAGHTHYTYPNGAPPDIAAGACVSTGPNGINYGGGTFHGGSIEYGADGNDGTLPDTDQPDGGSRKYGGPGAYMVIDGHNSNTDPSGNSKGYIGVSNYESNSRTDTSCNPSGPDQDVDDPNTVPIEGDRGSNSGWCTYIGDPPGGVGIPTPIVGGADSSPDYDDTPRDGWKIP